MIGCRDRWIADFGRNVHFGYFGYYRPCAGCLMSQIALTEFVEDVLKKKKVPGIKKVILV